MNEGKLRGQRERASNAERLLNEPLIKEAFDYLDTEFMRAWKQSSVEDTQARERIYNLCQALEAVKGHLKSVVETGKMAKAQLDQLKK